MPVIKPYFVFINKILRHIWNLYILYTNENKHLLIPSAIMFKYLILYLFTILFYLALKMSYLTQNMIMTHWVNDRAVERPSSSRPGEYFSYSSMYVSCYTQTKNRMEAWVVEYSWMDICWSSFENEIAHCVQHI